MSALVTSNQLGLGAEGGSGVACVVKAELVADSSGRRAHIYVVLTDLGVLTPLVDYFAERMGHRSVKWMQAVACAVVLFVRYLYANRGESSGEVLLRGFAQAVMRGTLGLTLHDPSGLFWTSRSLNSARRILSHVGGFLDWRAAEFPRLEGLRLQHRDEHSLRIDEAAYQQKRARAFLGHIWAPTQAESGIAMKAPFLKLPRPPHVAPSSPCAFPEARLLDLLERGFHVGERRDYRSMCITVLMNGAGFRPSEPLHLYVEDVQQDPLNHRSALVFIHHPKEGRVASSDPRYNGRRREDFLAEKWSLPPRNDTLGYRHVGWKGGMHERVAESQAFRAHWFPPFFGEVFLSLWRMYLRQLIGIERDHPFAFVNLWREPVGAQLAVQTLSRAHADAVRRIGLAPLKAMGTTLHGHRHAYGRRLRRAGVSPKVRQTCMHHSSILSQDVYTRESEDEVYEALASGAETLARAHSTVDANRARQLIQSLEAGG